ncbi:MAG TPA: hypothetical protein VGF74_01050 [Thermoleophilaceae bacterium]|jgi:hypothetical protein
MHASIWKFNGDPDDLLRRFDAMSAEIPSENIRLQLVLRASDGFVLVDTCPSKEVFDGFVQSDAFNGLRVRHGLPEPDELEDFPVHTAVVEGKALA